MADDPKREEEEEKLFKRFPFMRDVMNDPTLTRHQKKMKTLPVLKELRAQSEKETKQADELQVTIVGSRALRRSRRTNAAGSICSSRR
jgi:hypothetical protein